MDQYAQIYQQYPHGPNVSYVKPNSELAKRALEQSKAREEMAQQRRAQRRNQLGLMVQDQKSQIMNPRQRLKAQAREKKVSAPVPVQHIPSQATVRTSKGIPRTFRTQAQVLEPLPTPEPPQLPRIPESSVNPPYGSSILKSILDKRAESDPVLSGTTAIVEDAMEIEPAATFPPSLDIGTHMANWYGPWKKVENEIAIRYRLSKGIVDLEIPGMEPADAEYSEYIVCSQKLPQKLCPPVQLLFTTVVRHGNAFHPGTIVITPDGEITLSVGFEFCVFEKGQEAGHPYATTVSYFVDE